MMSMRIVLMDTRPQAFIDSYGLGRQMVLFISRQELESFPCGLIPMILFLFSTFFFKFEE